MAPKNPRPKIELITHFARQAVRAFVAANQVDKEERDLWSGFRIPAQRAARQLAETAPEAISVEAEGLRAELDATLEGWLLEPPADFYGLAELATLFKLSQIDVELLILAAAPAIDPSIQDLYAFVWDNIHKRNADLGFICQIISLGDQERFEEALSHCDIDAPLRRHRLIAVEERQGGEEQLDLNLVQRRVRAADRVLDFLRRGATESLISVDEALAATCVRLRENVELDSLRLPQESIDAIVQLARSRKLPALLEGPEGAGKQRTAQATATLLGRGLISADLTALLTLEAEVLQIRLAELMREARLGHDLLYFRGHDLPEMIAGPTQLVLQRVFSDEHLFIGVDRMPLWLIAVTTGWPVINVPLPAYHHRIELWRETFADDRRAPSEEALDVIARRYEMSGTQIRHAAGEAKRLAVVSRRRKVELGQLDKACRTYFAHRLADLAELVPPSTLPPNALILPETEKEKYNEILLYSKEHDTIYQDWGFGAKFPYGRGLSVLFYGPPGTGKTMAATIIASVLGLDLFRVDLSRIMSRYVGETEKNLARVFAEAERGRVMLLFDEADALFTKRTAVKGSVDRYANLEVAYLLQRMENFEGVTVLTTNVEANLDDAFKRRIRYRVYFPMPDVETRAKLWKSMIPPEAPQRADIPFELIGEHFEISGGHIKQAVLRAAFYARRKAEEIGFEHLVEAATAECRELGMLMSDKLPKPMQRALALERGEPPPPEEDDEDELPWYPVRPPGM